MPETQPTLVVLAAGMGSRYGGLKQVDPVGPNGETIIDYSIYDAIRAGFGKVVFVIRRDIEEAFAEAFGRKFADKIPVEYAYQELDALPDGFALPEGRGKPWGTGHAAMVAEACVGENFAVINGDDFYGAESFCLLAEQLRTLRDEERAAYTMVGFVLRQTLSEHGTVSRGVCQMEGDGRLLGITETVGIAKAGAGARYTDEKGAVHSLSGNEIVSMNMWGFTPSVFQHLRADFAEFLRVRIEEPKAEFYLPAVISDLVAVGKGEVKVLETTDAWFGVTYREDKPFVDASIRSLTERGVYPSRLWG